MSFLYFIAVEKERVYSWYSVLSYRLEAMMCQEERKLMQYASMLARFLSPTVVIYGFAIFVWLFGHVRAYSIIVTCRIGGTSPTMSAWIGQC